MFHRRSARQRVRTSAYRRFRDLLSRLYGTRLQKSQSVYFVTINGNRFKRIILRDSYLASEIERNLESFGSSDHFPALVARYEHEIWVEYIEGSRVEAADETIVGQIADLYAEVYARASRRVPIADAPFLPRIQRDVQFLERVGVLSRTAGRDLDAAAERLAPDSVWVGFDYTDPVLKNFVIASDDGRICAIDVESLVSDQLVGTGFAKACTRWMEPHRKAFLERLRRPSVPDFSEYAPFVELSFLATYTKLMFLEKKWRNVDPARFDRFRVE